MSINVLARKLLWGRAGNRCAFPSCPARLIEDEESVGGDTVVGEEAHIVAQEPDGPRGKEAPPGGVIDGYPNLLLLCGTHHKVIDQHIHLYSVETLVAMKGQHETAVQLAMAEHDAQRFRDERAYAQIVDDWAQRAMLDDWHNWTSWILSHGQPAIGQQDFERLRELTRWLLTRVWPRSNPTLETAFVLFRTVLADFLNELEANGKRVGSPGDQQIQVEKFYKVVEAWDPPRYDALARKFDRAVHVIEALAEELTRAANLVCDVVRQTLSPRYRRDEGYVLLTHGPTIEEWDTVRHTVHSYPPGTAPAGAYRGLEVIRAEARVRFPDPLESSPDAPLPKAKDR